MTRKADYIKIHCKYDDLLDLKKIIDHPKNRNKHGSDQIEALCDLYKYHGIRHPIIISKLSGKIVSGHGRKLAAIRAGMETFPVVFQDFENEEKEYAFIQSDNAIALWADLEIGKIELDLEYFANFDIKCLGIKNFLPDSNLSSFNPNEADKIETEKKKCPHCGEEL